MPGCPNCPRCQNPAGTLRRAVGSAIAAELTGGLSHHVASPRKVFARSCRTCWHPAKDHATEPAPATRRQSPADWNTPQWG